jgi:hypothetical protein
MTIALSFDEHEDTLTETQACLVCEKLVRAPEDFCSEACARRWFDTAPTGELAALVGEGKRP